MNNPLKWIDPDGKRVVVPFSPGQMSSNAIGQKYRPVASTAKGAFASMGRDIKSSSPSAVTVSLSGKVAAFASVEGEVSVTAIFKGEDSGVHGYASGSLGGEKDVGISATLSAEIVKADKPTELQGQDLQGESTQTTVEVPVNKTISVSGSHTKMGSENAGKINNYGVGVSAGVGVTKLFGNFLDKFNVSSQSKETKGFKTNNYKEDDERKNK